MATIIPTSQQQQQQQQQLQQQQQTTTTTGVETYEDMFKEITRKLYGDETGHGLHTLGTPIAHIATSGPTAPEGGERSFTTLMTDRSLIEYETQGQDANNQFKAEDHLTTAFGLAALMQNGFPPPGAILNPHSFTAAATNAKPITTSSTTNDEQRWPNNNNNTGNINTATNDDILPWNISKINYPSPQNIKPFKPKRELVIPDIVASSTSNNNNNNASNQIDQKVNIIQIPNATNSSSLTNTSTNNINTITTAIPISSTINSIITSNIITSNNNSNINTNNNNTNNNQQQITQITKRYSCSHCPYSTDRRDLFTRHENIHKVEKPFHCYVCTKQFNRADHVKKHFLRMHRELQYDINKTRRNPAKYSGNNVSSGTDSKANIISTAVITTTPSTSTTIGGGGGGVITGNGSTANFFQNQTSTITIPTTHFQTNNSSNNNNQNVINNGNNSGSNNNLVSGNNQDINGNNNQQPLMIGLHQIKQELKPLLTGLPTQIKQEKGIQLQIKQEKQKKKGEKRFQCLYCPWTGADSWGLKRHLNTHTKPYVCMLCDYKAARSERLATHVFKVHNKKACNKCNFLADDQVQFIAHQNEAHQMQMFALSRNTASVAQDFHNAGGGYKPKTTNNTINSNNQTANHINNGTNTIKSTSPVSNSNNNCNVDLENDTKQSVIGSYGNYNNSIKSLLNLNEINLINKNLNNNLFHNNHFNNNNNNSSPANNNNSNSNTNNNQINNTSTNNNNNVISLENLSLTSSSNPSNGGTTSTSPTIIASNLLSVLNGTSSAKKRRRSSHDKENTNFLHKKQQANENLSPIEKHMKDAITKFYLDPFQQIPTTKPNNGCAKQFDNITSIHDYLKNNKELTISIEPSNATSQSSASSAASSSHRNRKQAQPRKITQQQMDETIVIDDDDDSGGAAHTNDNYKRNTHSPQPTDNLRDKHLIQLVSRKKFCKVCKQNNSNITTKKTLILHNLWHHASQKYQCKQCKMKFNFKYKLNLHKFINHK